MVTFSRLSSSRGVSAVIASPIAAGDVDRLAAQLDPARLDLGQVEHVVDQAEQVAAAGVDVVDPLGRHRPAARRAARSLPISSLNPMIAFSGVRSSWLMLATKSLLALLAAAGRRCRRVGQLCRQRLVVRQDGRLGAKLAEQVARRRC